jgi:LuxR family glucitol operon transcriptional activator
VLRRLGSGHSDIARFCFAESVAGIRGHDAERLLFALALFECSVIRPMLGEVAGLGDDAIGRDDGLAELLQLSLIDQNGERFKLLPLTHSFALEELAKQPEREQALRQNWLDILTTLAAPFNRPHWQQPDRSVLRREGEHLVALARWAEQQERPDLLLPIAAALGGYYDAIGRWHDMNALMLKSIEYARLLGDSTVLFISLNAYGWVIGQQGRFDEASRALVEAHALAESNRAWQAEILVSRAQLARRMGAFNHAHSYCVEALALLDRIEPEQQRFVRADITIEQGKIARDQGDWAEAQAHFQAAREVFQLDLDRPGFNMERAWGAYAQFAYVTHRRGNLEGAARMYREALGAIREFASRGFLATLLVRFAELEVERHHLEAAREYAKEALEWSGKLDLVQERSQAEALLRRLEASAP